MIEDMIDAGDTSRIEELTNPNHIDVTTLNPDEFIVGNVDFSLDYEDPLCFLTIEFDVSVNNDNVEKKRSLQYAVERARNQPSLL